jgi:hypothetical protein
MPLLADTSSLQDKHVDLPLAVAERNIPPAIIFKLIKAVISIRERKHNLFRELDITVQPPFKFTEYVYSETI